MRVSRRGFRRVTQSCGKAGIFFAQRRRGRREKVAVEIEPHRTHRRNRKKYLCKSTSEFFRAETQRAQRKSRTESLTT